MAFKCKLEKGKVSMEISVSFQDITVSRHCISEMQAEQMAKRMATVHMQQGWKLVMLDGRKVVQGKIVIPTISNFEKAIPSQIKKRFESAPRPRLPLGDGTVGMEE